MLPLRNATSVADAIARGRLDNDIRQNSRDEPGQLLGSMRRMQEQLQAVIAAQREMERQHEAGIISYRMDASAFPGDYGVMVAGTNQLVAGHIDTSTSLREAVRSSWWNPTAAVSQAPDRGLDRDMRDQFRGHPDFEYTAQFCHLYDQNSFDPAYESMPLSAFEPMLRRVLAAPKRSIYRRETAVA